MKYERIVLTPGFCKDLKPKEKRYFVKDYNCPGLWLQILPTGFKTWYYRYRPRGKDKAFIKLGRFEMLNPAQARKRAKEIQGDIVKGNDPLHAAGTTNYGPRPPQQKELIKHSPIQNVGVCFSYPPPKNKIYPL